MAITRRGAMLGGAAAAALGAGALAWYRNRPPAPRPRADFAAGSGLNVLFVLTDQERAWDMLPAGFIETHCPGRVKLAEMSVGYSDANTPIQLCSMARGVVYTGVHAQNNGVWENVPVPTASDLSPSIPTLGTLMQDAGYRTGYAGKWHLSKLHPRNVPLPEAEVNRIIRSYGFDESETRWERDGTNVGHEEDGLTVEESLRFIHRNKRGPRGEGQPWFLAVNLLNPHDVMYYTSGPEMTQTRVTTFPDPSTRPPDTPLYQTDLGYDLFGASYNRADFDNRPEAVRNYDRSYSKSMGRIDFGDADVGRDYQNYYYNCLRDCDRHLLALLEGLEASGEADRTIIVFTSDHGEFLGAHALKGKGLTSYREGSQVPLYVSHPDMRGGTGGGGRMRRALASHVDIAPTLLGLAGVDALAVANQMPQLKGYDLSPVVDGSSSGTRRDSEGMLTYWTSLIFLDPNGPELFADALEKKGLAQKAAQISAVRKVDWDTRGQMRGIYDGRWKLSRYFAPSDHHTPDSLDALRARNDLELYDTQADPDETTNLAALDIHAETIAQLNRRMNTLIATEVGEDSGNYIPMFAR